MSNPESPPTLRIHRLPHCHTLPTYAHPGDAGMDLYSASDVRLWAGQREAVPTGIRVAIPDGYEMQIRPRSGLAAKHGITVLNAPGTIDAGYRGEVLVLLHNTSTYVHEIKRGERIAQAVIAPVVRATLLEVEALDETERGEGGLGSSGR